MGGGLVRWGLLRVIADEEPAGALFWRVSRAAGQVVEIDLDGDASGSIGDNLEIVRQDAINGAQRLRGVVKAEPLRDARPVDDITLEEAYLAFMVSRGRNADELEMTDGADAVGAPTAG